MAMRMQTNEMAYGAYGSQGATENRIKDYQNFLSNAPIQCFNCKPSEDGKVEVTLKNLANFSQIFVIACDKDSFVERQIDVCQLL